LVAKNVAAEEGAPKVEADEVVILTEGQIAKLLTKLTGRAIYSRVIVALFTGVRRGELLALRWSNTDLEAKIIRIREALEETKANGIRFKRAKTKSGRRDITLPDIVVDTLREHRRQQLELRMALGLGKLTDDALVFTGLDGGPQSPRAFSGDWSDAAERIGMGDITLHALRHTHASQLIDAGVDVVTISKRLGHASPNITLQIYAHLFRKRDDKAAEAINAALATLGKS
jgi:integrase